MKVLIGHGVKNISLNETTFEDVIADMKEGKYEHLLNQVAEAGTKEERRKLKRVLALPYIVHPEMSSNTRNDESFKQTNKFVLDIDELLSEKRAFEVKEIFARNGAFFCYITPSRKGVRVIYLLNEFIHSKEKYKHLAEVLRNKFMKKYPDLDIDLVAKKLSQAYFLGADRKPYYNPDAKPIDISGIKIIERTPKKSYTTKDVPDNLLDMAKFIRANGYLEKENYEEYLKIGFSLASLGEEGREAFLLITSDHPIYAEDTCEKLNSVFDSFLKDYKIENADSITIGSFIDIARQYGYNKRRAKKKKVEDKNESINGKVKKKLEFTDVYIGKEFALFVKDMAVYIPHKKKWYVFDGTRYKEDVAREIEVLYSKFLETRLRDEIESGSIGLGEAEKLDKYKSLYNMAKVRNVIAIAEPYADHPNLDEDIHLFNVLNGIIKLEDSGHRFIEHSPKYNLSFLAPVKYDENALASKWIEFIKMICKGDVDLIEYLQKYLGYCMSGRISDQSFIFLYGSGANGKSTYLSAIRSIFGDYAASVSFTTFTRNRNNNAASPDLARLGGKRFVITDESIDNRKKEGNQRAVIDSRVIKGMTGGEKMVVRGLFENDREMDPLYKVFLSGNHQITIDDFSTGMQRRVRQIPMLHKFVGEGRRNIEEVLAEFKEESSGILNWLLDGWEKYCRDGLIAPRSVIEATEELFLSQSNILSFIKAECDIEDHSQTKGTELYAAYTTYCERVEILGSEIEKNITFYATLDSMGYRKVKNRQNVMHINGLRLKGGGDGKEESLPL